MKDTLSKLFIFAAGAAVGSAVTWKFIKTKYEQIAQEEIDSVKEIFGKTKPEQTTKEDVTTEERIQKETDFKEYAETLRDQNYTNYSDIQQKEEENNLDKPYVISPEEFGEMDDYDVVSLTLYADKILTDDRDIPIEDVENMVGYESLTHFGEYEDDSVFVRNDRLKTDYEILLDERTYSQVYRTNPHRAEGE